MVLFWSFTTCMAAIIERRTAWVGCSRGGKLKRPPAVSSSWNGQKGLRIDRGVLPEALGLALSLLPTSGLRSRPKSIMN